MPVFRIKKPIPILSSQNAYAKWAFNYPPTAHNPLMQLEEEAVLQQLPTIQGKIALDLACGTGRYSNVLLKKGAGRVIGIDNSEAMLRRGLSEDISIHWMLGNIQHLPLPSNYVDIIICGLAIGHIADPTPAFSEISRVLKKNGHIIISDFHPHLFYQGGTRTFTAAPGNTYAVDTYPHMPQFISGVAEQHNLAVNAVIEPHMIISGQNQPALIIYCLSVKDRRLK